MVYGRMGMFSLFHLIFLLALATVLVNLVKSILQWNKNNHSPRLTVETKIVAKRTDVTRRKSGNAGHHTHTRYYVTFQVESGDRMELQMEGYEYGMLVEGDTGKLTFQGTRYLGFERM